MPVLSMTDVAQHPATEAWRRLAGTASAPSGVEVLKETSKSSVYRLIGIGIIAKRAQALTARVERAIYQDILPGLPVSSLRFHGFLPDQDPNISWLFLEDSGGVACAFDNATQLVHASRWMAQLHLSAAKLAAPAALPARRFDDNLTEMHTARSTIRENLGNPALSAKDRAVLDTIVGLCDHVDSQRRRIAERCAGIPETLVHGDFHAKNVHLGGETDKPGLYVFDWEYAGWGLPAVDVAELDLEAYRGVAGGAWASLEWLADLGRLIQAISAIAWASTHLPFATAEKGMLKLRSYPADLRAALAAVESD